MAIRDTIGKLAVVAAVAAGALAAPAASAEVLRVCADPDNLPFSKAAGPERGLYLELAELVGKRLGSPVEYVWWLTHNQRRALRNTILQDSCDAYFALPAAADYKAGGLQRTRAFLDVNYAVVMRAGQNFSGLADLKGRRVAVLHASPPQIVLSAHEGIQLNSFRNQDEAMEALTRGEVDAAVLWGPSAGYANLRQFQGRWTVTPVSGEGLGGQVAVAVRKGQDALAARIDEALVALRPEIAALAAKYGFPAAKPVPFSRQAEVVGSAHARRPPVVVPTLGFAKVATSAEPATVGAGEPAVDIKRGQVRFNNTCSHCHGTNGASPISERDLRRLKLRYKDNWQETTLATIKNGRPDMGMPAWRANYSDQEIAELVGFLATIQR